MGPGRRAGPDRVEFCETKAQQIPHDLEACEDGVRFEKLLSFDRCEGDRPGQGVDQLSGLETIEAFEELLTVGVGTHGSNQTLELTQRLGAELSKRALLALPLGEAIRECFDAGRSIESVAGPEVFLEDPEPALAEQQDVERAVRMLLGLGDPSEAADVEELRVSSHRVDRVGADRDHPDLIRVSEGVPGHLAIARLEDVERDRDLREQDHVREREQRERFDHRHRGRSLAPGIDAGSGAPDGGH